MNYLGSLYLLFQGICHFVIGSGFDTIRGLIGPLDPKICKFATFIGKFTGANLCLGILVQTITRFLFVVIYKRIPDMNDSLIATIITLSILTTSLNGVFLDTYFNENVPKPNQVNLDF